jgi:large subunit ribosomal protein L24
MKSSFSTSWTGSKQPRKQRKFIYNAPLHVKHRFLSAHLSKDLRQKYGKRNLPLRKGDEVLVMRGFFKKKKAKVSSVDLKSTLVTLEGLQKSKKDGSKVNIWFHPSNLQIVTLELADKDRLSSLNRKGIAEPKAKAEKTEKKEAKKETKQDKGKLKPKETAGVLGKEKKNASN